MSGRDSLDDPDPGREPSAAARENARSMREMYVALVREGFDAGEALHIIGVAITAAIMGGGR